MAARRLILQEAPKASEFIYELYTIADHFTFTNRPGDAFAFTTTHTNWVNLGFNFGSLLPDPDGACAGRPFAEEAFMAELAARFGQQWKRGRPKKDIPDHAGTPIGGKERPQCTPF